MIEMLPKPTIAVILSGSLVVGGWLFNRTDNLTMEKINNTEMLVAKTDKKVDDLTAQMLQQNEMLIRISEQLKNVPTREEVKDLIDKKVKEEHQNGGRK